MKMLKKITAIVFALMIATTTFALPVFAEVGDSEEKRHEDALTMPNYEAFSTNRFDVTIDIAEDNTYTVKEHIVVNFDYPRHGIFRYIPLNGSNYRDYNGHKTGFPTIAKITNVKVDGFHKEVSTRGQGNDTNKIIKIGEKDEFVEGVQTYNISYKYRPYDDRFDTFDEFYYNLLPTNWKTPIENSTIIINFPKSFDQQQLAVFSGTKNNAINAFDVTVNDKTVVAVLNQTIPATTATTARVVLPQGYYTSQYNCDWMLIVLWVLILGCPLLIFIMWVIYGRDKKLIKPVAVMPPQGMTPADVGYIVDECAETKDVFSLLFYWADKGYMSIEEDESDKKNFIFRKIMPLPETVNYYENSVFDELFRQGDVINTKALKEKFGDAVYDCMMKIQSKYKDKKNNTLYTSSSKIARNLATIISVIPVFFAGLTFVKLNALGISIVFGVGIITFTLLVTLVVFIGITDKWNSKKRMERIGHLVIPIGLFVAMTIVLITMSTTTLIGDLKYIGIMQYYTNPFIPMLCLALTLPISIAFTVLMKKRTSNMNSWYGEILGFKNFLEVAEKERLEMLVGENQQYFFDILPYAYVLGVSNTWAKKFEAIEMQNPEWYRGGDGMYMSSRLFIHDFNNSFNLLQSSLNSIAPSSSGGFSGGGGGGHSGGGGGGGGGGSW